jgi:hypothetical protein
MGNKVVVKVKGQIVFEDPDAFYLIDSNVLTVYANVGNNVSTFHVGTLQVNGYMPVYHYMVPEGYYAKPTYNDGEVSLNWDE